MREETKKETNLQPAFQIYHTNPKGTGSAVGFRLFPATLKGGGYVQMEIAKQQTVGDVERKVFPTFNWKERIIVRLNPIEVAEIVRCIKGMTESIRDGAGFVHKSDGGESKITFVHVVEPKPCYQLKVMHETLAGVDREVAFRLAQLDYLLKEVA